MLLICLHVCCSGVVLWSCGVRCGGVYDVVVCVCGDVEVLGVSGGEPLETTSQFHSTTPHHHTTLHTTTPHHYNISTPIKTYEEIFKLSVVLWWWCGDVELL